MKKRFCSLMALAALAAALVSCSREKEVEVVEPAGDVTYRFELVEGTRATLNDDGVWWDASDHVGVFLGSENKNAEVEGTDTKYVVVDGPSGVSKGYAYYPYNDANTSAGSVNVVFPKDQIGGSQSAMPMAGIPFDVTSGTFNGQIHSLNLGSVIDFRVYSPSGKYAGEQVKSITFAATEGSHLAGTAKLDLTAVNPANESTLAVNWEGGSPQSSVTLTQTSASALDKVTAEGRHLYMVVAPGTYSGTITIVTNAATYSYTVTDKQFVRGGLHRYNMSLESSAATRASYYQRVNSPGEGGVYLIVYESGSSAKVFNPDRSVGNYTGSSVDATIESNRIPFTSELGACQVVLEKATGTSQFFIRVPKDSYNYLTLNANKIGVDQFAMTFSFNNGSGTIQRSVPNDNGYGSTTYSLRYNNSVFSSSASSSNFALYKPYADEQKMQPLRFSAKSFVYDFSGKLPVENIEGLPTLSGVGIGTTVKYYSNNDKVATVDPSSGAVSIRGLGTAVITAVAEANAEYEQGIASYTLKVNNGYSVENERVEAFLDHVEKEPYSSSDYNYSFVMSYRDGTSETNRLDIPKPVRVTWETSVSNPKVFIYNNSACTVEEIMAFTENETSTSADVYNLIPGRTYYYVVKEGENEIKRGSFKTTGRRRMIKVGRNSPYGATYANNCRDFGGLTTIDGNRVKFGKIYRGTNMDETTPDQKSYLIEKMEIRLDVDLRKQGNTISSEKSPNSTALGSQVTRTEEQYDNCSTNTNSWSWNTSLANPALMGSTLTQIFNAVSQNKGVYIHCKIGSDRTAFVCLLLQAILGVPQYLCDADYELTSFSWSTDDHLPRRRDDTSKSWYYYPRDGITLITAKDGSTFQEKAINYVKSMGITEKQITAFQEAMLEPVNQ